MWFDLSRSEGYPTRYSDHHIPVTIDVTVVGLVVSIFILAISFFAIIPAYSKTKRRAILSRVLVGLITGSIILVSNFGHNWEYGKIHMSAPYKPSSAEEIEAYIGLHVSLRGVNITLQGKPLEHPGSHEVSELKNERIDYNEHFSWQWAQGRLGFGYYAGQISKDFRAATLRGVPLPILQVAEYFTFDGEGIRFGRYYRLAGWYSHMLLWTALFTWTLSQILSCMIVSSASYFLILSGLLQLGSIGIWTFIRNPIEIQIPFQSANGRFDVLLTTRFGLDYYLVLSNGVFCCILGLSLLVLDSWIPDEMCEFFGIDPLTIYDELHLDEDDAEGKAAPHKTDIRIEVSGTKDRDEKEVKKASFHEPNGEYGDHERLSNVVLKRRDNAGSNFFRLSFKPKAAPRSMNPSGEFMESSSYTGGSNLNVNTISWPPPPPEDVLKRPPTLPPKPNTYR